MKKVNYVLRSYFHYLFVFGLIILPLTLKAHPHFPKVKLPSYGQVAPYYFGLREHKARPQTLDADDEINVNNITNKNGVKGDSLVKEWERTYDYAPLPSHGLDKDFNNNLLLGMGDNVTYSYIVKVSPVDGDTITVIARARSPSGSQAGDTYFAQASSSKDNRQIMVGMDRNEAEGRNNLWVGSYSSNGDSLWFKFYNRDSTSSEFFLLQKPAAVFSDGSIFIAPCSDLNMWSFCVDTLGNIKWEGVYADDSIEDSGRFRDIEIKNDTIWANGFYYNSNTYDMGEKFYIIDKDGNVINKKYYLTMPYRNNALKFSGQRLYSAGHFDGSGGYGYYTPFLAELDPQTLDTLWLKTYEGGVYRDERVEDMTIAGNYVFLTGYVNADTDTAAIWMVDTAGNYVGEFDRPNAIYTGATSIGDSLFFAYGRDEGSLIPLLVKYKIDKSGINEKPIADKPNGLELKVLNNPSPAPVVKVGVAGSYKLDDKVDVYNIAGQKVGSYHLNGGKTRIDGLKSGVYFIKCGKDKEKIVVMK